MVVSDDECGKLRLSADMALRCATALGVPVGDLLRRGPVPPASPGPSRRILRRLELIEKLPRRQQDALLTTIDGFLKSAGRAT